MKVSNLAIGVIALALGFPSPARAYLDTDVLIFALNLECLEAEYYSWAAYGKGLDEGLRGGGPPSVGGKKGSLGQYAGYAKEIADEEIAHVAFLRAALGPAAVPCPLMDIGTAFEAFADAAFGVKLDPPLTPYRGYIEFLLGSFLFEDTGVMAYNGAVGAIQDKGFRKAARSIMAIEAYHASVIRTELSQAFQTVVNPYNTTVGAIIDAGHALGNKIIGGSTRLFFTPLDLFGNVTTNLIPTDSNALALTISPAQVLNTLYESPTALKGGFFPNGINGMLGKTRGVLDQPTSTPTETATGNNEYTDADIINLALNLECLEAEFYSWAAYGKGLNSTLTAGGPPSIGGKKASLGTYQVLAEEIANEEITHVALLRAALGADAVQCPLVDVGPAFAGAADLALGTTLMPPFSPYESYLKFLHGGLIFEDIGVMAYNGAIEVLTGDEYLAAARGIMAVEAYHGGVIRTLLSGEFDTIVEPYAAPVSAITMAITNLQDSLLGLKRKQSIGPSDGNSNLTPTDKNALAYTVNPDQVLNAVYGSKTASKGGFFPNGVNGLLGKTRGALNQSPTAPATCTGPKAPRYSQCGGNGFTGPNCCGPTEACVAANEYYSGCVPTGKLPGGVVPWYSQCGGFEFTGPNVCEAGSECVRQNKYYSQCLP